MSLLPRETIEAFLDDWHRSKIFAAVKDDDQRRKVLPWLQTNGFGVYRQVKKDGHKITEEAVFPPKLDFLDDDEAES
jgi:hypothetical protein